MKWNWPEPAGDSTAGPRFIHRCSGSDAFVLASTVKFPPARFAKLNWNEPLFNCTGLTELKLGLNTPSTAPISANRPDGRGRPRWSWVKAEPLVQPSMAGEPGNGGMVGVGPP